MCLAYVFNRNPKNALWKHIDSHNIGETIIGILRSELRYEELKNIEISSVIDIPSKVSVIISQNDRIREKLTVLLKAGMCKNCSKMVSRRFDAVIQLRTIKMKTKKAAQILNPLLNEIIEYSSNIQKTNPDQFISDIDEFSHGFDLKLSNKAIMNSILSFLTKKYAIIVRTSKKLMGKNPKTGGDLYRTYLLLRYLPFSINSQIRIKNDYYFIKKINPNRILLENIANHRQQTRNFDFFEKKLIEIIEE